MRINPLFWLHALLDPVRTFDLVDKQGEPDHAKVVPFLVTCVALVLHIIGNPIPIGHLIVLISAAFGYGGWRTFLNSRSVLVRQSNSDVREHRVAQTVSQNTTRTEIAHVPGDER